MRSNSHRLDRFIRSNSSLSLSEVRLAIAKGRVRVDGALEQASNTLINKFNRVELDQSVLQDNSPRYLMLNKPKGVVSATKDAKHSCVTDLLKDEDKQDLHIVGRLDFNSTGLVLLTNDGRWSRAINKPELKLAKYYRVELENPIEVECIEAFKQGIYFDYEGITTLPAQLQILSERCADLTLIDGRYHQIKRMFGRFQNKVLELHRYRVGDIELDETLGEGQYRKLSAKEIASVNLD